MSKGFFTQGVAFLTDGSTTIDDVVEALENDGFDILKRIPASENTYFHGESALIAFRPEANGFAAIDVVAEPWPDSMGDPDAEPMLFGAWSMGSFGPFAFPGSLTRAGEQSWGWEDGRTIAEKQGGYIRLKLSYAFGADEDASLIPQDYNPRDEMAFLGRVSMALLEAPGVLCYFNPNGEVLRDIATYREEWEESLKERKDPLPLWSNVRLFGLSETLSFMDTVGNSQLDLRDVEAIFPKAECNPGLVDFYLKAVTQYLLDTKKEIQTGETIDGPGESEVKWTTEVIEDSLITPPRRVLRVYPLTIQDEVRETLAEIGK